MRRGPYRRESISASVILIRYTPPMHRRALLTGLPAAAFAGQAQALSAPVNPYDRIWLAAGRDPAQGRTDALLVQHDGQILYERYGPEHGPKTRHVSWSMAKSATHALVGAAVLQGRIDIDRPVGVLPAGYGVTLRHLLTLTDGLPWKEDRQPLAVASDASRLLFGPGRFDVAAFAASRPGPRKPPGTAWNYSTGAYHLVARELTSRLFPRESAPESRRRAMASWMRDSLFTPAGMTASLFEFDPQGTFYAGSLIYAPARDFARLGSLYLNDGKAFGRRVIPSGWARFAATPTVSPQYGAGWWLEQSLPMGDKPAFRVGAPPGSFHARGLDGQITLVVPSRRLVIVRLGYTPDNTGGWPAIGRCLREIIRVPTTRVR